MKLKQEVFIIECSLKSMGKEEQTSKCPDSDWVKSEETEKSLNVTEVPRSLWIEFYFTFILDVQGTKIKFYRQ